MIFTILLLLISTAFLISKKRYRWFYIIYKTIGRDVKAAVRFERLNFNLWRNQRRNQTVAKVFQSIAATTPNKTALYFEDEQWSFQKVENFSNQIANYFKKQGFERGDAVALFLENRPEYGAIWLGLSKIGVVTALINSNLVNDPLVHSITAANAKAVIYAGSLQEAIENILKKIPENTKLYQLEEKVETEILKSATDLSTDLKSTSTSPPTEDIEKGHPKDKLIFIYTSGTTGLPKAAVITNMRYMFMALALHYMSHINKKDIIYDCLPLYHSSGGIVGIGQTFLKGVPIVIRKKFSASNFWKDCAKYNCTVAQYIGEICRYILLAHQNEDKVDNHSVRKILGNGLRPQIWKQFVTKFNIEQVYEFYGSTEGNSNLINIDSTIGAVGFIPRYATFLYPVILVKCDEATGEPIRNHNGFCKVCEPGEVGVLLGVVNTKNTVNDFSGYADKKATAKKLLQDVFKKGDQYFNSGDVLIQDELGNFFFKDRTGDTFRWKGENVATSEIEAVISNVVNLNDAVVYGVEIPGTEGRAGMAAIVDTTNSLNMEKLCTGLKSNLPSYAVPIFIRVLRSVSLTGTFKLKKTDLQKDGFDINKVKDHIYIYDGKSRNYLELTQERYNDIMNGKIRL